jgi:hypothetical protein
MSKESYINGRDNQIMCDSSRSMVIMDEMLVFNPTFICWSPDPKVMILGDEDLGR